MWCKCVCYWLICCTVTVKEFVLFLADQRKLLQLFGRMEWISGLSDGQVGWTLDWQECIFTKVLCFHFCTLVQSVLYLALFEQMLVPQSKHLSVLLYQSQFNGVNYILPHFRVIFAAVLSSIILIWLLLWYFSHGHLFYILEVCTFMYTNFFCYFFLASNSLISKQVLLWPFND